MTLRSLPRPSCGKVFHTQQHQQKPFHTQQINLLFTQVNAQKCKVGTFYLGLSQGLLSLVLGVDLELLLKVTVLLQSGHVLLQQCDN